MNISKKNDQDKKGKRAIVRKTKLTILGCFIVLTSLAQTGINYKALIKDVNGNVVSNTDIDVEITLLQGAAMDTVYRELHSSTTDNNGIVILTIGEGITEGDIGDVEWSLGEVLLNVQINTGSGLVDFGTTSFQYVPFAYAAEIADKAKNVTGLEAIDEGNGYGWRLIGINPDNYGNIGFRATDLSYSNLESSTYGATGTNSVTMGIRTSANGDSSVAIGSDNTASDDFSTAIGAGSTASGGSAIALGSGNQALENSSTAIGYNNTASGFASTALGYHAEAFGQYATAIGNYTDAGSYSSVAIGRYNNGSGNATIWNDFDPLFEIGNGSSDANRSNALTVYKNGRHIINSTSTGLIVYSGSTGINVSDPDANGIEISSSGDDGLVINSAGGDGIVVNGAADDGLVISASDQGARISGSNAGLYANGGTITTQQNIPDIILGSISASGVNLNDDGIISTNPDRPSSDMYLRSYDAVVVHLDYDNNEVGNFRVRNGTDDIVFDVNESGDLEIEGFLRIGTETIEDGGSDALRFNASLLPDTNNVMSLGNSTLRWTGVWAVDGTINTSDRREKKNIKDLDYGLSEVLQMQPVSFNWINKNNPDTKLGLIAQDLQSLIPEVVISHTWEKDEVTGHFTKKELNRLGVYYSDLVPVLIKAIQEQQKIIETQNKNLQSEQDLNAAQKTQLDRLAQNYQLLLSRIEHLEANNQSN